MVRESNGMTVIVCENLGRPALLIKTTDKPILLLNAALSCDQRIKIMARFLESGAA